MIAQIHRYNEKVAICLGEGGTIYVSPEKAKRIAKHLKEYAADILKTSFTKSTLGAVNFTI